MLPADDIIEFFDSSRTELERGSALVDNIEAIIELGNSPTKQRVRNGKVRLALLFSPNAIVGQSPFENEISKNALEVDEPRYVVCSKYIQDNFDYSNTEARDIGKSVQRILDLWEKKRKPINQYKEKLLREQSYRCNHCHLHFRDDCLTYANKDEYKPVYKQVALTDPEVDHIDPVWALGHNTKSNAQILCRFCNQGKGGETEPSLKELVRNSAKEIGSITWKYRAEIFYLTLLENNACEICENESAELTVRPIRNSGCYLSTNLRPICVDCAY